MKLSCLSELDWLQAVLKGESEGESFIGKLAVACTIRNRVNDQRWPDTYKGVILQPSQFESMAILAGFPQEADLPEEFSYKFFPKAYKEIWWRECRAAAWIVFYDWTRDITKGANHFYAHGLIDIPYWAKGQEPTCVIGGHTFYRL